MLKIIAVTLVTKEGTKECMLIEILLSIMLLIGTVTSSKNIILYCCSGLDKSNGEQPGVGSEEKGKNFYLIKLVLGKLFFLFSLFMVFVFKDGLDLLLLFFFYILALGVFTGYQVKRYFKAPLKQD